MKLLLVIGNLKFPLAILLGIAISSSALAKKADKVDICHFDQDAESFFLISVSGNAVEKHKANHGDVNAGSYYTDSDGDGLGDGDASAESCPNIGLVDNNSDACPNEAADTADGCPAANLGSDIAIPGFFSNKVSVLLNNGDGTFGGSTDYEVGGNNPDFATVGDFNNDGDTDLSVSVNGWGNNRNIAILFGNGDGTFGARRLFQTSYWGPSSQAVADYNNDGNLDIVVQGAPGNVGWVSLHLGDGMGNLSAGTVISPPTRDASKWVTGGDFDEDGNADVATVSASTMVVYLSNGDGTFAVPTVNSLGHCDARGVTNGDVDGDGDLDIVTANVCGSFSTFLNNGDGTFSNPILSTDNNKSVYYVGIADFDGDGSADVLTSGQGGSSVFKGNGDGTFSVMTVISDAGGRAIPGDFNEDGKADFATNSGPNFVSVWLGNGDGTFSPKSQYQVANNPATLTVGNFD